MTDQKQAEYREAFEAWIVRTPYGRYSTARRGDSKYDSSHTQLMWETWQEARAYQAQQLLDLQAVREDGLVTGLLSKLVRVKGPLNTPMWEAPDGQGGQFANPRVALQCWLDRALLTTPQAAPATGEVDAQQPDDCSVLLPPWFDMAQAPRNGATILGMYAAKESYLGDDGPRHYVVRWSESKQAFCTHDSRGEPMATPTLTHWQPLTYLHSLYGHTVYPVPGAYYAYDLPPEWKQPKQESSELASMRENVAEQLQEKDGFWYSCSGCYEGGEYGGNAHNYPHSDIFQCSPGSGCHECGGIGVRWDSTDYSDFGNETPSPAQPDKAEAVEWSQVSLDHIREYWGVTPSEMLTMHKLADIGLMWAMDSPSAGGNSFGVAVELLVNGERPKGVFPYHRKEGSCMNAEDSGEAGLICKQHNLAILRAYQAALSALPKAESGLVKELRAELRHFKGRPAVEGKPLELQTRDELLAAVHGLQAENDRLSFEANAGRQAEAEADAEAKELAEALHDAVDSLKYVQSAHPEATGRGVRSERIWRAEKLLTKYKAQEAAGAV